MKDIFVAGGSRKDISDRLLAGLRDYSLETFEHSSATAACTVVLARRAGLGDAEVESAASCALLHDIGKIEIPLEILEKPDSLTDAEMEIMKTHSLKGYEILVESDLFAEEAVVARVHHEWHNGEGYPDGIAGDDIPYIAKLVAVADVFDALTSEREYRNPLPASTAIERIVDASGSQFDPGVVSILCSCSEELEALKGS